MTLTFAEKQEALNRAPAEKRASFRIAILRNVTLEPLETYLRYELMREGYDAHVSWGGFDTVYQDALEGRPDLLSADTGAVLVVVHLPQEAPALVYSFPTLDADAVKQEIDRIVEKTAATLSGIRQKTRAPILWHSFETPLNPALGVYDSQVPHGQMAAIRRLNDEIGRVAGEIGNVYVVDMNLCLARVGGGRFYEPRHWHRSRLPYGLHGLEAIADEELKILRAVMGRARKCLVLDCDNVLWGGVVGEEGLSGIALGTSAPGSAYQEFQKEVLSLHHRGVILALCSKNNEDDVWDVFDHHPAMVLEREHVSAWRINWRDKAENLRALAFELNVGLDSLVFVDDSPFEADLVRRTLPEVDVLHIPRELATRAREILARYGKFDALTLSREDERRAAMYKEEASRRKLRAEFSDIEGFYRSLEMEVVLRLAEGPALARVAQQTQKTNQFNLTTRRYSEAEVRAFAAREDMDVIALSLSDRLGDSGIVGTCIVRYGGGEATIDTFLLSCRVLGRRVETAFLHHVLERAKRRGARRVRGDYVPTSKNGQVEWFYRDHGFAEVEPSSAPSRTFVLDLSGDLPREPAFFKSVAWSET